jgi:glycosyltransferase involved in cell wall biosynthesis
MDKHLYKTTQLEILSSLANKGYDVSLFAVSSDRKYQNPLKKIHMTIFPLRDKPLITNISFVLSLLLYLPFYVIRNRPRYIIIEPQDTSWPSVLPLLFFPKSIRPKIILDARTELMTDSGYQRIITSFSFNSSFYVAKKLLDGITTITPILKKEIASWYTIDSNSIGIWTSGVNINRFDADKFVDSAKQLRHELGLDNKFVVFYHGSFGAERGILEAIKSLEYLRNEKDIKLFLLGAGNKAVIVDLIKSLRIGDTVVVHEPVCDNDVPKYIAMADVGILVPSDLPKFKGQCFLKLLEYLSMRKVVIVSDIPAIRAVIGYCKCGLYVPGKKVDPKIISEKILYAKDNRQQLTQWGLAGEKIAKDQYSWKKVAQDFEDYISAL